jgi:hypothetical protein
VISFERRIFNRLAIGPTTSARRDCANIAAEADARITDLVTALRALLARSDLEYWPVEREMAHNAIAKAEAS